MQYPTIIYSCSLLSFHRRGPSRHIDLPLLASSYSVIGRGCSHFPYNRGHSHALWHTWWREGCLIPPFASTSVDLGLSRLPRSSLLFSIAPLCPSWVQRGQSSTSDQCLWEILQLLQAVCCLGFFGFLRSVEFTCPSLNLFQDHMLSPREVLVDSLSQPSVVAVCLRWSKICGADLPLNMSGASRP